MIIGWLVDGVGIAVRILAAAGTLLVALLVLDGVLLVAKALKGGGE